MNFLTTTLPLGCIHYVSYRGGQRILGGVLKFLEQKKVGYKNCLNISWGMLIFVRFCLVFVIVLKSEKRNDKQGL